MGFASTCGYVGVSRIINGFCASGVVFGVFFNQMLCLEHYNDNQILCIFLKGFPILVRVTDPGAM